MRSHPGYRHTETSAAPFRQVTPAYPPPLLLPRLNFRYQRCPGAPARACQSRPRGTPGPDANRADHDHQMVARYDGEPIMVPRWQAGRSRSERMKIGHTRSSSPSGGDTASRRSQRAKIRRAAKRRARPTACRRPQGPVMFFAPDPHTGHGRRQLVISMPLRMVSLAEQPPRGNGPALQGGVLSGAHVGASRAEGPGKPARCPSRMVIRSQDP